MDNSSKDKGRGVKNKVESNHTQCEPRALVNLGRSMLHLRFFRIFFSLEFLGLDSVLKISRVEQNKNFEF